MLLPKCRKRKTLAYFLPADDYAFDRTDIVNLPASFSHAYSHAVYTQLTSYARRAYNIIRVATTDNSMRQSACGAAQCPLRVQQKFLNGAVITIITFATPSPRADDDETKSPALARASTRSLRRVN